MRVAERCEADAFRFQIRYRPLQDGALVCVFGFLVDGVAPRVAAVGKEEREDDLVFFSGETQDPVPEFYTFAAILAQWPPPERREIALGVAEEV